MPEHDGYGEPYFGAGHVLFGKNCEGVSEVVNDLDGELMNFWNALRRKTDFDQLYRYLSLTPLAQEEFMCAGPHGWYEGLDNAIDFFIRCRQSRQALGVDYVTPTRRTRRGMNEQVSAWLSAVEGLPAAHDRLKRVEIRSMHAVDFIQLYDRPGFLHYCDPPYLHETRTAKDCYDFEMDELDHAELLHCLEQIEGKFMLSGYPSKMYDEWAARNGYRCEIFEIDNKASSKKTKDKKQECLWMNF